MTDAVVFMGSKAAGFLLCEAICQMLHGDLAAIICPDDSQDARSALPGFRSLAERYSVPLQVVATRADTLHWLDHYQARLAFVHGWYQIIPVDGPCHFYGFHYSSLPKYRGNAPLVWQIINGEPAIGVSFFRFSEGMDEGLLVGQASVELGPDETIGDALGKANRLMLEISARHIPEIVGGVAKLYPQINDEASYCGLRRPEDGLIDWRASAERVHDFIRAQTHPYPGAYTQVQGGGVLRVWSCAREPRRFYGAPGSVVEVSAEWVVVACGDGAVRLLIVSLDGAAEASAPQVLKSLKTRLI
ncbi:methionyl-tRNA formyltransferase [Pseudomonas sp. NPDC079086]|uniref:methionyl-tRNA formyltransferase n=1 Tax=unclassified Pseudomonas TaxID=196821 RepID=UPI0037C5DBDB